MPKTKRRNPSSRGRRDHAGHIDPVYGNELLDLGHVEPPPAPFVRDTVSDDDLAEHLAERALEAATSGEDTMLDVANEDVPEEMGGPFLVIEPKLGFVEDDESSSE